MEVVKELEGKVFQEQEEVKSNKILQHEQEEEKKKTTRNLKKILKDAISDVN